MRQYGLTVIAAFSTVRSHVHIYIYMQVYIFKKHKCQTLSEKPLVLQSIGQTNFKNISLLKIGSIHPLHQIVLNTTAHSLLPILSNASVINADLSGPYVN